MRGHTTEALGSMLGDRYESNELGQVFRLMGCWAKRQRGEDHLGTFRYELSEHKQSDPMLTTVPALHWGCLIDDAVHNYRSSLDHLAFQVVIIDGGEPNERTQFPIATTRKGFRRQVAGGLRRLATEHIEMIRECQPYLAADPTLHPLTLLRELSNIDEHRVLHVVGVERAAEDASFRSPYLAIGNSVPLLPALGLIERGIGPVIDRFEPAFRAARPRTKLDPEPWQQVTIKYDPPYRPFLH